MKGIGLILLFFGIGPIVLDFFGYEFVIMFWIFNWGVEVAWIIIKSLIGGGVILFVLGMFFDGKISEANSASRLDHALAELRCAGPGGEREGELPQHPRDFAGDVGRPPGS